VRKRVANFFQVAERGNRTVPDHGRENFTTARGVAASAFQGAVFAAQWSVGRRRPVHPTPEPSDDVDASKN
jgi:hypothetical protein